MSGCECSFGPGEGLRHTQGFTLLELLVVLLLVALVAGLAAPASMRALDAARERGLLTDLEAVLESLPIRAFASGQVLELDAAALRAELPDLPTDWQVTLSAPLAYGSSGVARGGQLSVQVPGREPVRWEIEALTGHVQKGGT